MAAAPLTPAPAPPPRAAASTCRSDYFFFFFWKAVKNCVSVMSEESEEDHLSDSTDVLHVCTGVRLKAYKKFSLPANLTPSLPSNILVLFIYFNNVQKKLKKKKEKVHYVA